MEQPDAPSRSMFQPRTILLQLHQSNQVQCGICDQIFEGLIERFQRNDSVLSKQDFTILQKYVIELSENDIILIFSKPHVLLSPRNILIDWNKKTAIHQLIT